MKSDFLTDLYHSRTETIRPPADPAYRKAQAEFSRLEAEFQEKMGYDFVIQFGLAQASCAAWEGRAVFLEGLRLGMNLMLAVWPPNE